MKHIWYWNKEGRRFFTIPQLQQKDKYDTPRQGQPPVPFTFLADTKLILPS